MLSSNAIFQGKVVWDHALGAQRLSGLYSCIGMRGDTQGLVAGTVILDNDIRMGINSNSSIRRWDYFDLMR